MADLAVTGDVEDVVGASQEVVAVAETVVTVDGAGAHGLYASLRCCRLVYHFLRDFRSFSTACARSIRSRSLPTASNKSQDRTYMW